MKYYTAQVLANYGPQANSPPLPATHAPPWPLLQPCSPVYIFFNDCFPAGGVDYLWKRPYVTSWSNPKIFTIWSFTENICRSLIYILKVMQDPLWAEPCLSHWCLPESLPLFPPMLQPSQATRRGLHTPSSPRAIHFYPFPWLEMFFFPISLHLVKSYVSCKRQQKWLWYKKEVEFSGSIDQSGNKSNFRHCVWSRGLNYVSRSWFLSLRCCVLLPLCWL